MFVKNDAGRAGSKRSRQKNDCTVRAVALAIGLEYDTAYELLAKHGRECNKRYHLKIAVEKDETLSKRLFWKALNAKAGQARETVESFCKTHPIGTYIIRISKHVLIVRDGIALDTDQPRWGACVYGYWEAK